MFRENRCHQRTFFSSFTMMGQKVKEKLMNSWAELFYKKVFCEIDEKPFAVLYCQDNGRPNVPVNILLGFELIKHLKDYSDEDLLGQLDFNLLIIHALGGQDAGDISFAPRTLYDFRRRVYQHTIQNPDKEDLIFGQFTKLADVSIKTTGISTKEQRMDSTQVATNIKLGGRSSLAYDVLEQAIKACPEDKLSDSCKLLLSPNYKTDTLYRLKGNQARMERLQEMINLGSELLGLVESRPDIRELRGIAILRRFIGEQAYFDFGKEAWIIKENKDIAADSLQSAYDEDATYRRKSGDGHVGLVTNISETCAAENSVQIITDYTVEKNIKGDTDMLKERLPGIKERTGLTDLSVDGGYFGGDVETLCREAGVEINYTNMTGSEPDPEKISITAFNIEDYTKITACPQGHAPYSCQFNNQTKTIFAHFSLDPVQGVP